MKRQQPPIQVDSGEGGSWLLTRAAPTEKDEEDCKLDGEALPTLFDPNKENQRDLSR